MRWRDLGFALPFSLALLPGASAALTASGLPVDLAAWFPLLVIFGVVPILDALLGSDTTNPTISDGMQEERSPWYRGLVAMALPVWFATLAYCTYQFHALHPGFAGILGWTLSTGVLGGILAITPAHELIHKKASIERAIGGVLLTSVGYFGFKIEHVRGHHVHVATPQDASTAPLGESAYSFLASALSSNTRNAWLLEAQRMRQLGHSPWSPRNEMLGWTLLWLVFLSGAFYWQGLAGAAFFLAQGLIAAATLEIINYMEHYGLVRAHDQSGRYVRVSHLHSWNASQRLSNWLLFNLQRHSDHHAHARRRYQALLHHDDSPQLPAGYATMFVLALLPPLWRRVMDPRARGAREAAG